MPLLLGNKKEKRSYIEKGLTKEQEARRSLVRGRLFADGSDENDDSDLNIPRRPRMTPRRTRSQSRGPACPKKEKRRSRSMSGIDMRKGPLRSMSGGLGDMRKSLLRGAGLSTSTPPTSPMKAPRSPTKAPRSPTKPLRSPTKQTHSPTKLKPTQDDIMSSAVKRVQERRRKKMEDRGVLIETIMMEDQGGVHYDSDDDSVDSTSSPTDVTTNLFYRGLQALEQMYFE